MKTVIETALAVRNGSTSAVAETQAALGAIENNNPQINAFVYIDATKALVAAERVDALIKKGIDPGPLAGVPIGVKDLHDQCAGMPTRNGSLITQENEPSLKDSEHISRLRKSGAVIVGKTATAEYGLDGVTHTLAHGTTRNPWNLALTPSGSSGGSSAAVAGSMVPLCTGSDGLGSIRCPAGFTGLVGLKPSMGRIPRISGFADTTCLGALTTTVTDTARYLDVVTGPEDGDRMTLPHPGVSYEKLIATLNVKGLRAIWSADLGFAPITAEVEKVCYQASQHLVQAAGLNLVAEQFECTNAYVAWNALAAARLRRQFEAQGILPEQIELLSPGPRQFIETFAYRSNDELNEFEKTVMQVEQDMAQFFTTADVLLTPTTCCVPYAAEGPLPVEIEGKDASHTNGEPYTALASIAWNPSISVPAGLSAEGLPIGLLITTPRHRDDIALRLARIFEQVNPWSRYPSLL